MHSFWWKCNHNWQKDINNLTEGPSALSLLLGSIAFCMIVLNYSSEWLGEAARRTAKLSKKRKIFITYHNVVYLLMNGAHLCFPYNARWVSSSTTRNYILVANVCNTFQFRHNNNNNNDLLVMLIQLTWYLACMRIRSE